MNIDRCMAAITVLLINILGLLAVLFGEFSDFQKVILLFLQLGFSGLIAAILAISYKKD